jgi:tRNA(Ile)-lysidine synthase
VDPPLVVRGQQPGDRLRPLGSPGERALKELFVDRKVPAPARSRVPLVLSRGRILWVGGLALAEESRIREDTDRLVRLSIDVGDRGESA